MKQQMSAYTAQDQLVWQTLFERQEANLKEKVSSEYMNALLAMKPVMHAHAVPNFQEVDEWFASSTGWKIEVVPGLIPVDEFFRLLAEKRFSSSTWLRRMDQLDYLEEPDMFHDTFGHIPLLSNPVFSDFMQTFGELGCQVQHNTEQLLALQRLYWFTIEFGMLKGEQPLIYGAGIISSFGETNRAISTEVEHRAFQLEEVLQEPFRTDVVQEHYSCIESFDVLFQSIQQLQEKWTCLIGN